MQINIGILMISLKFVFTHHIVTHIPILSINQDVFLVVFKVYNISNRIGQNTNIL